MAEELHFDNPVAAAQDPSTDAEALRQLAYRYPELRPAVAAHPHAYRGLLDWLHQFNDPQVNAALEARDDYDGYIDSNGYLVMHGDVSGAVAGSSIRTSESGMYVLGQGGVNSYSQVERTTPYSAVVGTNAPVPQVGAREQVDRRLSERVLRLVLPERVGYPGAAPAHAAGLPGCWRVLPGAVHRLAGSGPAGSQGTSRLPVHGCHPRRPCHHGGGSPRLRYLRVHAWLRGARGRIEPELLVVLRVGSDPVGKCHDRGTREVPGARRSHHR